MKAGVSPCVALCALFPERPGKDTESGFHSKNRADLTRHFDGSADSGAGSNLKQGKGKGSLKLPLSKNSGRQRRPQGNLRDIHGEIHCFPNFLEFSLGWQPVAGICKLGGNRYQIVPGFQGFFVGSRKENLCTIPYSYCKNGVVLCYADKEG